jgi:cell division protein ZapA (FtsZ GTPase activity inhibitor)
MDRNEVYRLLLNFAKGVKADTTIAEQVMGVGKAIQILDREIRIVIDEEQKVKYNKLVEKIDRSLRYAN